MAKDKCKVYYSPSNGSEWEKFLEKNCYSCKHFSEEMLFNRETNTCNILFKLLEQQGLFEKDYPEIYQFEKDTFDFSKGYPPICLKKEEKIADKLS